MIRRIEWRENVDTYRDGDDSIRHVDVTWDVVWIGDTSHESGGQTFQSLEDSLIKVAELAPSSDFRFEGSLDSGWIVKRFDVHTD